DRGGIAVGKTRADPARLAEAVAGRFSKGKIERLGSGDRKLHREAHGAARDGVRAEEDEDLASDLRDTLAPRKILGRAGEPERELAEHPGIGSPPRAFHGLWSFP